MKRFLIVIPIGILAFSLNYLPAINKSKTDNSDHIVCNYQTDDKKCSFCHNDIIKHEFLHAPVADECETCHQSTGSKHPRAALKGFTLADKTPDLCYICHEQKNEKSHIHAPVETGECNSCHDPHGSKFKSLLSKESASQVCNSCHEIDLEEGVMIHAPIELDGCQSCHDSHQSDHDFLLPDEKNNFCATCHDNITAQKSAEYQHAPFDDDCSNCHDPHSSKNSFLLTASPDELCFTCHDDIGSLMKDAKNVHKVAEEGENCHKCHSAHASAYPNILKHKKETLCFTCHNKEIKSSEKTIENIESKFNESKFKHSALEIGGCELCHSPHASDNNSLLTAAFPEGEYAPASSSSFELCFNCHDSEMMEKEFTETATNFRNGKVNLHYVHIKGKKGRNCNICHDMHASDDKHLIKRRTKFGTWDMPMNYRTIKDGATCRTGCHTEKKYLRTGSDSIQFLTVDTDSLSNDTTDEDRTDHLKDTSTVVVDKPDTIIKDSVTNQENTDITAVDQNVSDTTDTDTLVVDRKDPDIVKNEQDSIIVDQGDINPDQIKSDSLVNNQNDTLIDQNIPDTLTVEQGDPDTDQSDSVILVVDKDDPINDETDKPEQKISAQEAFNKLMPMKILFNYAKDELINEIDEELQKILDFMTIYPDVIIEIGGHTDYIGSASYNIDLSKKRAQAVKRLLNSKGVIPGRIKIKGYGESYPVDTNLTPEGRANNRRVEFKIKN